LPRNQEDHDNGNAQHAVAGPRQLRQQRQKQRTEQIGPDR
jgi:hypothetical protein